PYDGHGRHTASDPFSRPWPNEARRDPSRQNGTAKSWPASGRQTATSPKNTAENPARMLRESGRQQGATPPEGETPAGLLYRAPAVQAGRAVQPLRGEAADPCQASP